MNVYIGLLLIDRIENLKAYRSTVKQIQHFLALHTSHIKVIENESLLTIRPLYNNDEFTILKDCNYLHTVCYRLTMQEVPAEPQLDFFQVCLECLLVLKQHFPSKIDIQIEADNQNLKVRLEAMTEQNKGELSRRYLSNLKVMMETETQMTRDQLDDVVYLLRTEQSSRLKTMALTLISRMSENLYLSLREIDVEVIDQLANYQEYSRIASMILAKLVRAKTMTVRDSQIKESVKFDEPNLLKSHLFQLKQSSNLERITFLIDKLTGHIGQLDSDELQKVDQGINQTVMKQLAGKYQNGKWLVAYTVAVLKYTMQRRAIKNLNIIIQLITQTMQQPECQGDQLRRAVEEFIGQFGDRCGERDSRELGQLIEKSYSQPRQNLQTSRQTAKSVRAHHSKSTYIAQ